MSERLSILIVDDEPENLDLLERTLGFDYDVHRASSGAEALEVLKDLDELAVIITDQRMPGLSGTELLRHVRLRKPEAVRVILTGYTSPADLIEAINSSNVYRYMTKPWNVDQLTRVVRRATRLYQAGGDELLDESTALPNRGLLLRELEREVSRAGRSSVRLAVLALRVEGDDGGGALPELTFVEVADALRRHTRSTDLLAAPSRGVFAVVLTDCVDLDAATARLRDAASGCDSFARARESNPRLEIAIARAIYPADGDSAVALLRALALYP